MADTPSMQPASTTTQQKRPNPINSSPAEISAHLLRAENTCNHRPLKPLCPPDCPRLVNSGSFGVLVLARPSAREDGKPKSQKEPESPRMKAAETSGGTHLNRPDHTAAAVSN